MESKISTTENNVEGAKNAYENRSNGFEEITQFSVEIAEREMNNSEAKRVIPAILDGCSFILASQHLAKSNKMLRVYSKEFMINIGKFSQSQGPEFVNGIFNLFLSNSSDWAIVCAIWFIESHKKSQYNLSQCNYDSILIKLLKNLIINAYPKICLYKICYYNSLISDISQCIAKHFPMLIFDWIMAEMKTIKNSNKFTKAENMTLDIALYLVNYSNFEKKTYDELKTYITDLLPLVILSDSDTYKYITVKKIFKILKDDYIRNSAISTITRLIKRPQCSIELIQLLEYCIIETKSFFHWKTYSSEIIRVLVDLICLRCSSIITDSPQIIDNQFINACLNIVYLFSRYFLDTTLINYIYDLIHTITCSMSSAQEKLAKLFTIATTFQGILRAKYPSDIIEALFIREDIQNGIISLIKSNPPPLPSSSTLEHFRTISYYCGNIYYSICCIHGYLDFCRSFLENSNLLITNASDVIKLSILSCICHSLYLVHEYGTLNDEIISMYDCIMKSDIALNLLLSSINKNAIQKRLCFGVFCGIILWYKKSKKDNLFDTPQIKKIVSNPISYIYPSLNNILHGLNITSTLKYNVNDIYNFQILYNVLINHTNNLCDSKDHLINLNSSGLLYTFLTISTSPGYSMSSCIISSFIIQLGTILLSFNCENSDLLHILNNEFVTCSEMFNQVLLIFSIRGSTTDHNINNQNINKQVIYSITNILSEINDLSICRSIILEFATLLARVYALKKQNHLTSRCNIIDQPTSFWLNIFKALLQIPIIKGGPLSIGLEYCSLLILCLFHPLLSKKNIDDENFLIYKNQRKIMDTIFKIWHIDEAFLDSIIGLIIDSTFLPSHETTGFRIASLSMVYINEYISNDKFSEKIAELIYRNTQSSIRLVRCMPEFYSKLYLVNPNTLYIDNKTNSHVPMEEMTTSSLGNLPLSSQSSLTYIDQVRDFIKSDNYNRNLTIFDTLVNYDWLYQVTKAMNLENKAKIDDAKDKTNKPTTKDLIDTQNKSAFNLAKLRKSQSSSKPKVKNSSVCTAQKLVTSSQTQNQSLTKQEIVAQQIIEQSNIRKLIGKIINQIVNSTHVIQILLIIKQDNKVKVTKVFEENCTHLLFEITPLLWIEAIRYPIFRFFSSVLPKIIPFRSIRLGIFNSLYYNPNSAPDESLQVAMSMITESNSTNSNIPDEKPNMDINQHLVFKNSYGLALLVTIGSNILLRGCLYDEPLIQNCPFILECLSNSLKYGCFIPTNYITNLLTLYLFALGPSSTLDYFLNPFKKVLYSIKVESSDDMDLILCITLNHSLDISLIVLKFISSLLNKIDNFLSYKSWLILKILSESKNISKLYNKNIDETYVEVIFNISDLANKILEYYPSTNDYYKRNLETLDTLVNLLISPATTELLQLLVAKAIDSFTCKYFLEPLSRIEVIDDLIKKLTSILSNWETKPTFSSNDWPSLTSRSMLQRMYPSTIHHWRSLISTKSEHIPLNVIRAIQTRHSINGILFTLSLLALHTGSNKLCQVISFTLTNVVDSKLLRNFDSNRLKSEEPIKNNVVKNRVLIRRERAESTEYKYIKSSDEISRKNFRECITSSIVYILDNLSDITHVSDILISLQHLASTYKPINNSSEFQNILAFSIGYLASHCAPSDTSVVKICQEITLNFLQGNLCEKSNSKLFLNAIPSEYNKILPQLFNLIYNNKLFNRSVICIEDLKSQNLPPKCCPETVEDTFKISLSCCLYISDKTIQIGASHVIGALTKGIGVKYLRKFGIIDIINNIIETSGYKSSQINRKGIEGCLLCIGSLCIYLNRLFEPYSVNLLPLIMKLFADNDEDIRIYAQNTAEIIIQNLSIYGVKLILPIMTKGIHEKQWRTKLTSLRLLEIMTIKLPHQLAAFLPEAIQTLCSATSDSHPKVSEAARQTLENMSSIVKNPEIQDISSELITALVDPNEINIKNALQSLRCVTFIYTVDVTTLALLFPVLFKALAERSTEIKKDSIKIITSLVCLLRNMSDILPFFPVLQQSIHIILSDPIPEVRLLTAKLCGVLARTVGEEKINPFFHWLIRILCQDIGPTLRSGASAALAEIIAVFGVDKFQELLPFILAKINSHITDKSKIVQDNKPIEELESVNCNEIPKIMDSNFAKEGYIGLFVYLPRSFGEDMEIFVPKILPCLLNNLGDDNESVRDVALRSCKAIVIQFGRAHAALLLQPLEDGLSNSNWRVRLNSCSLLGILLDQLIKRQLSVKSETLSSDNQDLEEAVFSPQRRSYILAALYMARSDSNIGVRNSATGLWKSLVHNTPQMLKEILPILIRRIINYLNANNSNHKHVVAIQCLNDLVSKFGETIHNKLLPLLYQNLGGQLNDDGTINTNTNEVSYQQALSVRLGACSGVLEILKVLSKNDISKHTNSFLPLITVSLIDPDINVRQISVECLNIIANENNKIIKLTVQKLIDDILKSSSMDTRRLSALELIIQLPHSGIVDIILSQITLNPITPSKIYLLKSMSKIPVSSKLKSCLYDIIPTLLNVSCISDEENTNLISLALNAASTIVTSLDEQGMDTFITIILTSLRDSTPYADLSLPSREVGNGLNIKLTSALSLEKKPVYAIRRSYIVHFLSLTLFPNSVVFEVASTTLIKVLIPMAICDPSEHIRQIACKALVLFTKNIDKGYIVKVCSSIKETIASLVFDPIENKSDFKNVKLIGVQWVFNNKIEAIDNLNDNEIKNTALDPLSSIYLQGILLGNVDDRENSALGLGEIISISTAYAMKPLIVRLAGPLIRTISDRNTAVTVRVALLHDLVLCLTICGSQLRPLLPQIQSIFLKYIADSHIGTKNECSHGIGLLFGLIGNRSEALLDDLCSTTAKIGISSSTKGAIFNAITMSLNINIKKNLELIENLPKNSISEDLTNKLIGFSQSVAYSSDEEIECRDAAINTLIILLMYYCNSNQVQDILFSIMRYLNTEYSSIQHWIASRILYYLVHTEGRPNSNGIGWKKLWDLIKYKEYNSNIIFEGLDENILVPPHITNPLFYKCIISYLYNSLKLNGDKNIQIANTIYNPKKLAVNIIKHLAYLSVYALDRISASIIINILPLLIEDNLNKIFSGFSNSNLLLQILKICELIYHSQDSKNIYIEEIQININYYPLLFKIPISTRSKIEASDILLILLLLPSIQCITSISMAVKIKAEYILATMIGITSEEDCQDKVETVIQRVNIIYPNQLTNQTCSFLHEYARRVLTKIEIRPYLEDDES
ncbi:HEAT repeat family protein [Cryptosporidium serpentis]